MSRNSKAVHKRTIAEQFRKARREVRDVDGKKINGVWSLDVHGPERSVPKHGKRIRMPYERPSKVALRLQALRKEKQGNPRQSYSC